MTTDTSAEAVERLAAVFDRRGPAGGGSINGVVYGTVAATLRALLAERDAAVNARNAAIREVGNSARAMVAAETERDAAQARLRACFRAWATLHNTLNCIIHEEDNDPPDIANAIRIARNGLDEAGREMDAVGIRAALAGEPQR